MGMLEFSDIDSGYYRFGCQPVEQKQSSSKHEQSDQYQTDVGPESKAELGGCSMATAQPQLVTRILGCLCLCDLLSDLWCDFRSWNLASNVISWSAACLAGSCPRRLGQRRGQSGGRCRVCRCYGRTPAVGPPLPGDQRPKTQQEPKEDR